MSLYDQIIAVLPELEASRLFVDGTIILQNDLDETGDFIAAWNYSKPIPEGMKLGK
jgi:hypothetical protein